MSKFLECSCDGISVSVRGQLGSLSNYDDDDKDNVKKQLVLWAKQLLCTCITFFSTFLWRPLHDYDVKPPDVKFCGGRGHTATNCPSSIWTWMKSLKIELPYIWWIARLQIDAIKFERTQIHWTPLHLMNCAASNRRHKVWKDADSLNSPTSDELRGFK